MRSQVSNSLKLDSAQIYLLTTFAYTKFCLIRISRELACIIQILIQPLKFDHLLPILSNLLLPTCVYTSWHQSWGFTSITTFEIPNGSEQLSLSLRNNQGGCVKAVISFKLDGSVCWCWNPALVRMLLGKLR